MIKLIRSRFENVPLIHQSFFESWWGGYVLFVGGFLWHDSKITRHQDLITTSLENNICQWFLLGYCKFPKYSDTQRICCNHSKIWTMWLYHNVMSPNDADGMANSVDPDQTAPLSGSALFVSVDTDQTAPLGAVWSGSALFVQSYLSENLGSLRYLKLYASTKLTV